MPFGINVLRGITEFRGIFWLYLCLSQMVARALALLALTK